MLGVGSGEKPAHFRAERVRGLTALGSIMPVLPGNPILGHARLLMATVAETYLRPRTGLGLDGECGVRV